MKKIVLLQTQAGDWEGLYINGELHDEGHIPLGEGYSRTYLLRKAKEFNFTIDDLIICELNDEDEEVVGACGGFHAALNTYSGKY